MDKKKNSICLKILGCLFIVFIALFIANESGYYESKIKENVIMTDEEIKDFEKSIQNGDKIDLNSYMKSKKIDYSSKMSKFGDIITDKLMIVISDGAKHVSRVIKTLF